MRQQKLPHRYYLQLNGKIMDGLLPIYKAKGLVSKDVSRILQKIIGKTHTIGHVGTLDPMAEGVLPIVLGKATRLQDYLLATKKTYEFRVQLGQHRDTLDADGQILLEKAIMPFDEFELRNAASSLVGSYEQVPPLYSAVKWKGKPLYEYARAGQGADVPLSEMSRKVEVYSATVMDFGPDYIDCKVECGKGTYVRVFAYELCKKLENYGYLTYLKRSYGSGVSSEDCLPVEKLDSVETINRYLIPMERLKTELLEIELSSAEAQKLLQGQKLTVVFPIKKNMISVIETSISEEILIYIPGPKLIGIGEVLEIFPPSLNGKNEFTFLIKLKRGL
jgi:tRNA pseudouridine55 synthase